MGRGGAAAGGGADGAEASQGYVAHREELRALHAAYGAFLAGKGRAVLVSGESGVGKSALVSRFLTEAEPENTLLLQTACYLADKASLLLPWNDLMLQLDKYISRQGLELPRDLQEAVARLVPTFGATHARAAQQAGEQATAYAQGRSGGRGAAAFPRGRSSVTTGDDYAYRASKNAILQTLLLVARQTRTVVEFDNIQAMDALSLDLLTALVNTAQREVFIVCTAPDVVDYDTETFISATRAAGRLTRIPLWPLTIGEAGRLVQAESGGLVQDPATVRMLFEKSQGNTFFLCDLARNLVDGQPADGFSPRTRDILNNRLNGLGRPARALLDVIAVFSRHVNLEELTHIQKESAATVLRQLEELKSHALISEAMVGDRACFQFCHERMRLFVYGKIQPTSKRRLHILAGEAIEHSSTNLGKDYPELVYHYTQGGDAAKALRYTVRKLPGALRPTLADYEGFARSSGVDLAPSAYLEKLMGELSRMRRRYPDALSDYAELESGLLAAYAHCCLLEGHAPQGLAALRQLFDHPEAWAAPDALFRAYHQLLGFLQGRLESGAPAGALQARLLDPAGVEDGAPPLLRALFWHLRALPAVAEGRAGDAGELVGRVLSLAAEALA